MISIESVLFRLGVMDGCELKFLECNYLYCDDIVSKAPKNDAMPTNGEAEIFAQYHGDQSQNWRRSRGRRRV